MWILDAITDLIKRKGVNVEVTLGTGYTNMKNKDLLVKAQDAVWQSGKFMPTFADGVETTYCNLAVANVATVMGYERLNGLTADEIMKFIRQSRDWRPLAMKDCQFAANMGTLVIAGLDDAQLDQGHGHVCTLTPGKEEYSGHWGELAPACLSIGRQGICFRNKGVNWAFVPQPEFWAWADSL